MAALLWSALWQIRDPGRDQFAALAAAPVVALLLMIPAWAIGLAADAFGRWLERRRGESSSPAWRRFVAGFLLGSAAVATYVSAMAG
ncbi:hypothetical protein [Alienimonas californiensis]|uniref:Uncharacterized protein n=1 Tax=Alienimonas californiensis TaxID=2527989 RepID=A0A517P8H8_9PLAN|nr:hypothetical protein [Alienimonas californiensis]QDT15674.1 hypothetical protein CA12_17640 [Alienimonas californiensis]